ncbi:MAG: inorganic phosphate transporter [Bacteroidales bacterium]
METIYFIIVIFLALLAISDLVVGVSNDAVNFMNSAIGSKAAPFKYIILIAALGVLLGSTFSNGMMEIARNGMFNPEMFSFNEVMTIFMAVMIADIILLEIFNSYGFPTSTTVSLIFELLGASVAAATFKVMQGNSNESITNFLNSDKALTVISAILISVAIAFSLGAIIQWFCRLIFSFNIRRGIKYFGGLFAGVSVTAIFYFLIIKGAKGSSLISPETFQWIESNTLVILSYALFLSICLFQLLISLFNINVFRVIILLGTFALSFAFAGNDLVNFIGVPLAGLASFEAYTSANGSMDMSMGILRESFKTPLVYLLFAGLIMVATLYLSRKARRVIQTEIKLTTNQKDTREKFESTPLSRAIVRVSIRLNDLMYSFIPQKIKEWIDSRFEQSKETQLEDGQAFDQLRAAVNLVVSSILIALGTSFKLPLSTTYVTFMVAMGTSLIDGAWGRDTAVYRVSGVITIIGGWFFTGLSAFTLSFIIGLLIMWGGIYVGLALAIIVVYIIINENFIKKSELDSNGEEKTLHKDHINDMIRVDKETIFMSCNRQIQSSIKTLNKLHGELIDALIAKDNKALKAVKKEIEEFNSFTKNLKRNLPTVMINLQEESIETGHHYIQLLEQLREVVHALQNTSQPIHEHYSNNHTPLHDDQIRAITKLRTLIKSYADNIVLEIENERFEYIDEIMSSRDKINDSIGEMQKEHLRFLRENHVSTRRSMLYLTILNQSSYLTIHLAALLKNQRAFYVYNNKNKINKEN